MWTIWAAEADDRASELSDFGADASELLNPDYDPTRPRTVCIPTMMADVLMAVLLTLPRPDWAPINPSGRMSQRLGSAWRNESELTTDRGMGVAWEAG